MAATDCGAMFAVATPRRAPSVPTRSTTYACDAVVRNVSNRPKTKPPTSATGSIDHPDARAAATATLVSAARMLTRMRTSRRSKRSVSAPNGIPNSSDGSIRPASSTPTASGESVATRTTQLSPSWLAEAPTPLNARLIQEPPKAGRHDGTVSTSSRRRAGQPPSERRWRRLRPLPRRARRRRPGSPSELPSGRSTTRGRRAPRRRRSPRLR